MWRWLGHTARTSKITDSIVFNTGQVVGTLSEGLRGGVTEQSNRLQSVALRGDPKKGKALTDGKVGFSERGTIELFGNYIEAREVGSLLIMELERSGHPGIR